MSTRKMKEQPFPGGNLRNWMLVASMLDKETRMTKQYDRKKFEDITSKCVIKFGLVGIEIYFGKKRIIQSRKIENGEHSAKRSAQIFYVVPEYCSLVYLHHYHSISFVILRKK